MDKLIGWLDNVEDKLLIKAIDIAVGSNVRNLKYIEGIIKNCLAKEIKTLEQFIAAEDIRAKSKQHTQGNYQPKSNKFINYEQRQYDPKQLKEIERIIMDKERDK